MNPNPPNAIELGSSHAELYFILLLSSADFFQNYISEGFSKNSFRNTIMRVSNSLDPDQDPHNQLVLIWVQTVCKGYQQKTKVAASKERVINIYSFLNKNICCGYSKEQSE